MSPCPEAADATAGGSADAPVAAPAKGIGAGARQERDAPARGEARRRPTGVLRWLLLAVALPVLAAALALPPGARADDAPAAAHPAGGAGSALAPRHTPPASPPLHVLCDEDLPPYAYKEKGPLSGARGIYPELAAEAFRRMGLAATMVPTPWARAIAELNRKDPEGDSGGKAGERVAVCGLYATTQRRAMHDFSAPLFEERLHLLLPASAAVPQAPAGYGEAAPAGYGGAAPAGLGGTPLAALRGMRLGVVRGWSYGDTLDAARATGAIITEEAGSEAQNLLKVAGGRLDGAIITREGGLWLRERLGLTRLVIMAPQPLAVMPVHLAFRRQDGQRHLLRAFDAAIRAMKADGSYARIVERALNSQ